MAAQIVDVVFYDGVVSKPWAAKISPIDAQSVLIRYGENLRATAALSLSRHDVGGGTR